jgi:hypothetical protein
MAARACGATPAAVPAPMGAAAAANTPAAGDEPTANPVWPSKRIAEVMAPEAGGDLSGGAKRKRQATARLREDARSMDPADIPGQLHAGTFESLIELLQIGEAHGRSDCPGRLAPVKGGLNTSGLVATVKLACSEKDRCCWAEMRANSSWTSAEVHHEEGRAVQDFWPNDSLGQAIKTNPVSSEHAYRLLHQLGFTPRSIQHTQKFINATAGPYICKRAAEDMKAVLADIDSLFAAFDAAHSSVRNAEQTTAVLTDLRTGLIAWMEHDSAGASAAREKVLLVTGLAAMDALGKDVPACWCGATPMHSWLVRWHTKLGLALQHRPERSQRHRLDGAPTRARCDGGTAPAVHGSHRRYLAR